MNISNTANMTINDSMINRSTIFGASMIRKENLQQRLQQELQEYIKVQEHDVPLLRYGNVIYYKMITGEILYGKLMQITYDKNQTPTKLVFAMKGRTLERDLYDIAEIYKKPSDDAALEIAIMQRQIDKLIVTQNELITKLNKVMSNMGVGNATNRAQSNK